MRRRFLADEINGDTAALTGQNARHLAQVLRARVGQEFDIAADGRVRLGKVVTVGEDRVEFHLGEEVAATEVAPITLLLAIFKFDRFEWAVEKATELGVTRIVPVVARRTERHLAQSALKRVERWRRIAHEAAQQSRRTAAPEIADPIELKKAIGGESGLKIVCAESEDQRMLRDAVEGAQGPVTLAIGPEGGWADEELKWFADARWQAVSLGETILRAETAVIAAVAVCSAEMMRGERGDSEPAHSS
ncbi:MAG TPA: RsmE family RNA methyltransferase [Terriglobales bacterium]|nr:RsmE family RNA methyltransferase [Terriglobales bacterium]